MIVMLRVSRMSFTSVLISYFTVFLHISLLKESYKNAIAQYKVQRESDGGYVDWILYWKLRFCA